MTDDLPPPPNSEQGFSAKKKTEERAERVHRWIFWILQGTMGLAFLFALYEGQWATAAITLGIISLMFVPDFLGERLKIDVPKEFEILALMFVFAALFLGEVRGYYERFWWWDMALHATSGLLLGILGFLLVYILNETERVELHMRPAFVAFFAFVFAVAMGALWEIFEFAMDQIFGTNMQKPMLGDPSGLTDTMWDLILDTLGALIISILGWWHMSVRKQSFFDVWIRKFVERNPRLFGG